jgi:hypothetical protein
MELLDLVKIEQLLGTLKRFEGAAPFNHICFNEFEICFYAGPKTFSEPTVLYDSLLYYKTIQIHISENIKGVNETIAPGNDNRFQNFDWCKHFKYSDGNGKNKNSYMGSYVPLEEVCRLIKDVYKVSRLKIFF